MINLLISNVNFFGSKTILSSLNLMIKKMLPVTESHLLQYPVIGKTEIFFFGNNKMIQHLNI